MPYLDAGIQLRLTLMMHRQLCVAVCIRHVRPRQECLGREDAPDPAAPPGTASYARSRRFGGVSTTILVVLLREQCCSFPAGRT